MAKRKRTTAKARRKTTRGKRTRTSTTITEASTNGHVRDGSLTFVVQGGEHDGETIRMDATLVKIASQALERKYGLETKDGQVFATTPFLRDLDKELQTLGYQSTPTIAHHAWVAASEYFAEMQKKTN